MVQLIAPTVPCQERESEPETKAYLAESRLEDRLGLSILLRGESQYVNPLQRYAR